MDGDEKVHLYDLEGMALTPDGQHVVIQFTGDEPIKLAMASAKLPGLAQLALHMAEQSQVVGGDPVSHAFDVAHWSVSEAHDGHLILVFQLPTSGQVAFRLPPAAAKELGLALVDRAGGVPLPPTAGRH